MSFQLYVTVHGSYPRDTQTGENSIRTTHKNLGKTAVSKLAILLKVLHSIF